MLNNGQDLDEVIHSNGTQSGTSLTLQSNPSDFLIKYLSSDSLKVTGNGVAQVKGNSGGFTDLTISPISNIEFTSFKFNLDLPNEPGYSSVFTFDAQLTFVGGLTQTFTDFNAGDGNGNNRFTFTAQGSELINQIVLSGLHGVSTKSGKDPIVGDYDFTNVKQASFNFVSGVPEPATWAEFILGFGAIGVALRRRRSQAAVPA
jgi:PEP-CTERM motif